MIKCSRSHCLTRSKGFTLLELLIAVSLSAVLMTVLVVGLNIITRDWEKHGNKLEQKLDESLLLLQIEKAILGTYPYSYKESSLAKESIFFSGTKNELLWVSTVSPDQSSGLKLWHLKNNDEGGLTLNLLPVYPGNLSRQLEKYENNQAKPSLYFSNYEISFHFLSGNKQKMKRWTSTWDAKKENKLPIGVRIDFSQNEKNKTDFSVFGFIRSSNSSTANRNNNSVFGSKGKALN